jgi:hypothetical protein
MLRMAAVRRFASFLSGALCGVGMDTGRDARCRECNSQQQKGSISANIAGFQPSGSHATETADTRTDGEISHAALRGPRFRAQRALRAPRM